MSQPDRTPNAASTRGLSEEMESESGLKWEVRWLHFNDGCGFEHVTDELARIAQGWEPFATLTHRSGGWALLVKRPAQ